MFGLVTVLVLAVVAPSSFGQVNIQLIPQPSPGEIQTNRNAQTADPSSVGAGILVSGSIVAPSPLTTTTLTITYPSPITSAPGVVSGPPGFLNPTVAVPIQDPIRIEGGTGLFSSVTAVYSVSYTGGTVQILLPGFGSGSNSQSGSFRLVGVRIDDNGKTGAQSVSATLSSSANNYILQTTSATVINAVSAGIGSFAIGARSGQTDQGTASVFTNKNVVDPNASIVLAEGFASAFRTNTQLSNSNTGVDNSTQIRLTFNNVPAGVTLTLTINDTGATWNGSFNTASDVNTTVVTSTTNTATISFRGTSLTATETVEVDVHVEPVSPSVSLGAGTITATATLVPIGDALDSNSLPSQTGGYPRFAEADLGPITVVNIVPASTTLLMPYAAVLPPFDTGLAVANTTADPFGATGGGATPASGTVTLNFFPTASTGGAGTTFSLTTSATTRPGAGLSSDGTLAAGATWTVLLSQVLSAAGQSGTFIGYVFIQTNFLNAHGTATISDFRTYSLTSNVLVLAPPSTASRNAPAHLNIGNGAETLLY